MDRRAKVIAIAERIEAADGRLADKKSAREKEERDRDAENLQPDEYRDRHGRCPPGYKYDADREGCQKSDDPDDRPDEKDEAAEPDTKDRSADKPADESDEDKLAKQVEKRKARREKLSRLFEEDFQGYQNEVARMRETGELPDRETSELLVQIDKIDDLPDEVLNDKEKLREIIEQQAAQRDHEERVLERTEQALQDHAKKVEIAKKAGKQPPRLSPLKLLQDIEEQFGRPLPARTEKTDKILTDQADMLSDIVSESAANPGQPSYWMKKFFARLTRPIPKWKPFESPRAGDLGLEKLLGASVTKERHMSDIVAVLDMVAEELERRGSSEASRVDAAVAELEGGEREVTAASETEIGFPPYDQERTPQRHIPDEPSGRAGFPPYDDQEPGTDLARDAKMKGFPPYDGKGGFRDDTTVGLPPYDGKEPHVGRGFPPYRDGKSVYDQRREAVEQAVE
jgi:hypothetical protein